MTSEEVAAYRQKEAEREANIQKNLKVMGVQEMGCLKDEQNKNKKGYVNEPVEYMDPIVQREDESKVEFGV